MNVRHLIADVALHAFGYAVAVVAAVLVAVAFMFAPAIFSDADGGMTVFQEEWPAVVLYGIVVTAATGLPGFVTFAMLARRQGWRGWQVHALAGLANAGLALFLLHMVLRFPGLLPMHVIVPAFPGGLVGGIAYLSLIHI